MKAIVSTFNYSSPLAITAMIAVYHPYSSQPFGLYGKLAQGGWVPLGVIYSIQYGWSKLNSLRKKGVITNVPGEIQDICGLIKDYKFSIRGFTFKERLNMAYSDFRVCHVTLKYNSVEKKYTPEAQK